MEKSAALSFYLDAKNSAAFMKGGMLICCLLYTSEPGGVLLPGAQQLPDGQHEPPLHIPAFDGAQDLLDHTHPVGRGGDAADRHAVDGQQGADAAPNVTKGPKRLAVGHSAGQDIPGL